MMPARAGWAAAYGPRSDGGFTHVPLVGWGDTGEPLICDQETGRLVPAPETYRGDPFAGVDDTAEVDQACMVPGQGWHIRLTDLKNGKVEVCPVVAFRVTWLGEPFATPVFMRDAQVHQPGRGVHWWLVPPDDNEEEL